MPPLLRGLSSDEYAPLPLSTFDRRTREHANEIFGGAAGRLGLSIPAYAADRRGTAATLRAIDDALVGVIVG